ncbi:MAG: hypothetical protein ACLFTY_01945 [Candidatus Aenigmatarchaeota archaeon]
MNLFVKDSGQFFSLITVLMALPLVALSITFGGAMSGYGGGIGEQVRLKSAYYYYHSLEDDLGRASEITGERAVVSAINHTVETGEGLNSSQKVLKELFVNGAINGEPAVLMDSTGIDEWFDEVEEISKKRGYILELSREEPDVDVPDPFDLSFNVNYSMELEDENGLFDLKKDRYRKNFVSVEGFEDPVVTVGTGGRFSLPVERCGFDPSGEKLAEGSGNNSWGYGEAAVVQNEEDIETVENKDDKVLVIQNLTDDSSANDFAGVVVEGSLADDEVIVPYVTDVEVGEITNGTRVVVEGEEGEVWSMDKIYRAWDKSCYFPREGPDFLQRLEYNLSGKSNHGIGVFLKKGELESYGVEVDDRPNLAHIYFKDEKVEQCNVKGMSESFKVSAENVAELGLNSTVTYGCGS